jgi:preprotein translocase subunit SecF
MRRLFATANYDFIGSRRLAYIISGVALVVCVLAAAFWQISSGSWLKYGVDFTGGTLVQVEFNRDVTVSDLRPVVEGLFPGSEITRFGADTEFLIRTPVVGDTTSSAADVLPQAFTETFGEGSFVVERTEAVGAKVGGELQMRALLAVLLSLAATLIYLAFRFEWRFGLAAVIATLHDVIVTMGLISMLRLEVALPTVAAVLTIVGYSLNDTIIIFDRVRENLHGLARKGDFPAVLNRSINETLPRTVLTTGTTLAVLLSLFLFGGSTLREFAMILIAGIVLGTYSSVFIAAPALLEIEKRWPAERKKPARTPARAKAGV